MSDSRDHSGSNQLTIAAVPDPEALASSATTAGFPAVSGPGMTSSQQRLDLYIGRTLDGRYLIEQVLGEGGMGVVYLGRHKVIDKRVAIKILRGDMAADKEMVERFLNEARAASSIGNPHIVDISDFGQLEDGSTYFVMEFLDGRSLGDLMAAGVIPVPRLVHIAKQIARGLAAAHLRGIVHRDLKPDNVMLIQRGDDRDFAKVLDFGIAKVSSEAGKLTRAGSVFGTPHYMSPEQAAGLVVDHGTDIYSLGVILYEMACGKVPFDADNFMGILTQHMYKSPAPIRALVPQPQEVPAGLEAIVLKCLSKKPELRYASMEELAQDLERVERGMVPIAVQEMMGRSGGFNVPADYFHKQQQVPGGGAMMPATPQLRPAKTNSALKAVVVAGLTVTLMTVGVAVGYPIYAKSRIGTPLDPSATADAAASVIAPSQTETAGGGPELRSVQIVTVPPDAIVFEGDKRLGLAPQTVGVPPGGSVKIRIEHDGYVAKDRILDGAKGREDISLDPIPKVTVLAVRPPGRPPPPPVVVKAPPVAPPVVLPPPPTATPPKAPSRSDCPEDWDPFDKVCRRKR